MKRVLLERLRELEARCAMAADLYLPASLRRAVKAGKDRGVFRVKMSWVRFWLMAVPSVAVVGFGVHTFFQYYGVGLDPQREQCLPGSRFIVYQRQYERPVRGQIYAFVAHNLTPYFEDGEKLFKVVDGVPGDTVEVSETGVSVNGVKVVSGLPLAKKLGSAGSAFVRTFVVPPRYYLMLGRTVDSYDGRYWGVVSESDLIGRVWQPIKDWKAHE